MALIIVIVVVALALTLYEHFDTRDWQLLTSADRNNVVFDQRNKKYGAYTLRRDYNDLVIFIMAGMVVVLFAGVLISSGFRSETPGIVPVQILDTTELTLEAPPMEQIETLPTPYKIGGGGSGTPSPAPYDPTPDPMVKKEDTQDEKSDSHIFSGKGNKTNSTNQNNSASTTVKGKNPFGSGGSGGGDQGGRGRGMGNDDGNGRGNGPDGDGSGGNPIRYLINKPNTSSINSDENCTIVLRVRINADGDVVSVLVDRSQTTTSNSLIINDVVKIVKDQAKYSKKEGAAVQGVLLKVNVSAH